MKTKSARSLGKGEKAVLMPGPTGAEPWELWVLSGGEAECVQVCEEPAENRLRRSTTLALPVNQVFCLPLWLNETDPKLFAGMIPLQLETRGLQPKSPFAVVFDWSIVAKENARTLVMVGVLPATLPPEIQAELYPAFDLSARYLPLPTDSLTLWQERDGLVFAFTRDAEPVYFQALNGDRVTPRVLQDLNAVRATLVLQGVLGTLRQVVVWAGMTAAERAALEEAFGLPVRLADRPAPRTPDSIWDLVPATVTRAKESRKNRRWLVLGLFLALIVYLAFAGWMMTRYLLAKAEVDALNRWQTENAPALALIRDTRAAWKDLRPVVDEKSYPLELLNHVQGAIPHDQLHLTLFEANDGHLLIKGEAKNAPSAFQFLDQLKRNPAFANYTMDMAQPHLLPNDLAQFQIDGTRGEGDF